MLPDHRQYPYLHLLYRRWKVGEVYDYRPRLVLSADSVPPRDPGPAYVLGPRMVISEVRSPPRRASATMMLDSTLPAIKEIRTTLTREPPPAMKSRA